MKKITSLLVLAALVTTTALASADPPKTYVETTGHGGQDVKFLDDPMTASGVDPRGTVITVRPSAARMMLLRPRTQFVTEMLKSVENL